MVRLSDDVFFERALAAREPTQPQRMTAAQREQLRGIGDRADREAGAVLAGYGFDFKQAEAAAAEAAVPEWSLSVGDYTEFVTPDGVRRCGQVFELPDPARAKSSDRTASVMAGTAIIKLDDGEFNIVPIGRLEEPQRLRTDAKRRLVGQALALHRHKDDLTETRSLIPINSTGDFAMTLHLGHNAVSETDVMRYVAKTYPGARVLDADDSVPGKLGVVLRFPKEAQALPIPRPKQVAPRPGVVDEEMEGTGHIGGGVEAPYSQGAGSQGVRHDDPSGYNDGDYIVQADSPGEGYYTEDQWNREKDRYQQQQPDEEKAKERRLRMQQETAPPQDWMTTSAAPATEDDGEQREHLGGPGLQVARKARIKAAVLLHFAQTGAQIGDEFVVEDDIQDANEKPIPARTKLRVLQTNVGRFADVILTDGAEEFVLEPGQIQKLLESDQVSYAVEGRQDPIEEARNNGASRADRVRGEDLLQYAKSQYPDNKTMQQAFIDGWKGAKTAARRANFSLAANAAELARMAVDKKTKKYYKDYYGAYGKKLTDPVKKKKRTKMSEDGAEDGCSCGCKGECAEDCKCRKARRAANRARVEARMAEFRQARVDDIKQAWAFRQGRLPTPEEVYGVSLALRRKSSALARTAQAGGGYDELVKAFIKAAPTDQSMQRAVDKMVTDAIANNPELIRNSPAYAELLDDAIATMAEENPQRLMRMQEEWFGVPIMDAEQLQQAAPQQQQTQPAQQQAPSPESEMGLSQFEQSFGAADLPQEPAAGGAPASEDWLEPTSYTQPQQQQAPQEQAPQEQAPQAPQEQKQTYESLQPLNFEPGQAVTIMAGAPFYDVSSGKTTKPQLAPQPFPGTAYSDQGDTVLVRDQQGRLYAVPKSSIQRAASRREADAANDAFAGKRAPAMNQRRLKLDRATTAGDYLMLTITWDPEDLEGLGAAAIRHTVISFVKQLESHKEYRDFGTLGKPRLLSCDIDAGLAEVRVRSSESRSFTPSVVIEDGAVHVPIA